MPQKSRIPSAYEPFPELIFCSNRVIGGTLIRIKGNEVILVGKGDSAPYIWLAAPQDKAMTSWNYVVTGNTSLHRDIRIRQKDSERTVTFKGDVILHACKKSDDLAEVTKLNLSPLGLAIMGDSESLSAGGNKLTCNTFEGCGSMIGFGE